MVRPPKVYRWLFNDAVFRVPEVEKAVYLTFDDGPHPEVTPFVLDVLKRFEVNATFFLLGKNAVKHPELVTNIRKAGHTIGNHGMQHLNGWSTSTENYISDVLEGKKATRSRVFRPAYGRLTIQQYRKLKSENRIVFWDVISGDFDQSIETTKVVDNVMHNVIKGSVVVFHDSEKAFKHLKTALSEVIQQLAENGYRFKQFEAE